MKTEKHDTYEYTELFWGIIKDIYKAIKDNWGKFAIIATLGTTNVSQYFDTESQAEQLKIAHKQVADISEQAYERMSNHKPKKSQDVKEICTRIVNEAIRLNNRKYHE